MSLSLDKGNNQLKERSGKKMVFWITLVRTSPDYSLADSIDDCPSNCFGNGDCVGGTCHCFLGFKGPDCGRGESTENYTKPSLPSFDPYLCLSPLDYTLLFQMINYFPLFLKMSFIELQIRKKKTS